MKTNYYESSKYGDLRTALVAMLDNFTESSALTYYSREGDERSVTYSELVLNAAAFGAALGRRKLSGGHIAIISENCPEWLYCFLGTTAFGGIAVMIDPDQSPEALVSMAERADADLIVSSDAIAPLIDELTDVPILTVHTVEGFDSVASFMDEGKTEDGADIAALRTGVISGDSVAAIAYTSGTSSLPKPVMLTHRGIALNASCATAMVRPTGKVFTSLPLCHTYGLTCGALCILFHGSNLGLCIDMKRLPRDMERFDAEILMAVPLMAETVFATLSHRMEREGRKSALDRGLFFYGIRMLAGLDRPSGALLAIKERTFGSLSTIVSGGAHLSQNVARKMPAFGITVLEGYGITECSPLVSVNRKDANVINSAGLPLPCCRVREEDGELLVSGPTLMAGYYASPEETAAAMRGEWFATGDMGFIDGRGFIHITGRKKNQIVLKNGKKIAPEEIEGYVSALPLVAEVMAYGAPSGDSPDDVRLAVTVFPDQEAAGGLTKYEVLDALQSGIDRINAKLPTYKQIQVLNLSSNPLKRTSSNKIQRR